MNAAWKIIPLMILVVSIPGTRAWRTSFLWNKNYPNPTDCNKDCDECHIVIAILISTEADAQHFHDVKTFILNSAKSCLENNDGRMAMNIIDPGTNDIGPWCEDYDCIERELNEITFGSSAVAVEKFSYNDTQTTMAAQIGRALLKPEIMADDRVPQLLIISNYISEPFASQYDSSLDLRKNLSQVHFRLVVVDAPIRYYQFNSSLSNADMQVCRSFALLAEEEDAELCNRHITHLARTTVPPLVIVLIIIAAIIVLCIILIVVVFVIVTSILKIKHLVGTDYNSVRLRDLRYPFSDDPEHEDDEAIDTRLEQ